MFIELTKYLYPSERGKWYNRAKYCKIIVNTSNIDTMIVTPHESSVEDHTVIRFNNDYIIEVEESPEQIIQLIKGNTGNE